MSSVDTAGSIKTIRWSNGFPAFMLGLIGGLVTGGRYHFPRVLITGSNVAAGLSLMGTLTNCFIAGDRLVMGDRFNRLVLPSMMKRMSGPYMGDKR
jgi:hypothetical protein